MEIQESVTYSTNRGGRSGGNINITEETVTSTRYDNNGGAGASGRNISGGRGGRGGHKDRFNSGNGG